MGPKVALVEGRAHPILVVRLGVSLPLDESRQLAIHLHQLRVQRVISSLLRAAWGQSFPGENVVPLVKPLQWADDLIGWVLCNYQVPPSLILSSLPSHVGSEFA
jgi:hypothetical protein